jgi:hypothetical protein
MIVRIDRMKSTVHRDRPVHEMSFDVRTPVAANSSALNEHCDAMVFAIVAMAAMRLIVDDILPLVIIKCYWIFA